MFPDALKSLSLLAVRDLDVLLRPLLRLRRNPDRDFYDKAQWEAEYTSGHWSFLHKLAEAAHNHAVCSYVTHLKPRGTLLDVGCGEGVLQSILHRFDYRGYLGIDLSDHAIERARQATDERTEFLAADATRFVPAGRFDAIIFNETLAYFPDPAGLLRRYAAFLEPEGIFVVSMAFRGVRVALPKFQVWWELRAVSTVIDEVSVVGANGTTWIVKALRPRG